MRSLVVLLLLAAPAMAEPVVRGEVRCGSGPDRAGAPVRPASRALPLGEMPPARAVLSVYREVDGCPVLLVRDGTRIVEEPVGRPDAARAFTP